MQALDTATVSAAEKARLRESLAALTRKAFEAQKAAAAANKAKATQVGCGANCLGAALSMSAPADEFRSRGCTNIQFMTVSD